MRADVAVVGGGFTGLTAALHLAQAGADVAVFEAETPGWGASGRNGGFCCLGGSAAGDAAMRRRFGAAARRAYRRAERAAVDLVAETLQTHDIDADRHSDGETVMAHTPSAMRGFEAEARRIEADLGVAPRLIAPDDLPAHGMGGGFHGAMTTPVGFAINPLKYTLGLARAGTETGAHVFAHSPVQGIAKQGGNFTLTTPNATVTARRLIVATNGYSSDDLPGWIGARYLPAQSNVLVTRPLTDEEIAAQGWSTAQMAYDDRFFLHYFRLMPDRRFLFGMRGGLFSGPRADAAMHRRIRAHFEAMFPAWAHVETPHSWNGLLSLARGLTPFAGAIPGMPGAFAGLSYHGNGIAMGSYAGALLADLALDRAPRHPYPEILATPPRRWPLGRFRRAALWPPYLWATLTGG